MLLFTKLAPPKEPKRRSRGGCTFCKEKKKKCDEERPVCGRCIERGIECTYEAVKPRQRRKRDSFASANPLTKVPNPPRSARAFADGGPDSDDSFDEAIPRPEWFQHDDSRHHDLLQELDDSAVLSPLDSTYDTDPFANAPASDFGAASPMSSALFDFLQCPKELASTEQAEGALIRRGSPGGLTNSSSPKGFFPDLAMISPCPVGSPLLDFRSPAFSEFSDRPNRRALVDHFCNILSHLIVFREESGNPFQQLVLPLTKPNSPVTNAIFALACAHLEYRGVENEEKSVYFHNQAIQGLAKQIEYGGPVDKNEVLAAIMLLVYYEVLVQRGASNIVEGHLKGAMTIMCTNPEPSNPTGVFLERAFRFYDVIAALSNGTPPLSEAPATGCLLPVSPLGASEASSLSNVDTLLGMATTLWPIIHRLSSLLSLKTELEEAIKSHATAPKIAVLRIEFESTAEAIEAALTNWKPNLPLNFVRDENSSSPASEVAENVTTEPEEESPAEEATNESDRIHSILHNALAYRHSAFVHLYRSIYSWPRSHSRVQKHAHEALTHCAATVSYGGPMGALLWPLFVAACEATSQADRALATRAFGAVVKRQGMMNIERAWGVVQEVWRRANSEQTEEIPVGDTYALWTTRTASSGKIPTDMTRGCGTKGNPGDLWRRVSADMGVHIVFG